MERAGSGQNKVSIFAVGDVLIDIPDGASAFRHARDIFRSADIIFGNCEGVYSDRPEPAPTVRQSVVVAQSNSAALRAPPFHAMSCANNHILDGGYRGLADTLDALRSHGVQPFGAGADIDEAFRPAIIERSGLRVAFLGVCTVFPVGYEARDNVAGLAPLRVQTVYQVPDANFWEPELDPIISSLAFPEDLARLRSAIDGSRAQADVVTVSCHWGHSRAYDRHQGYEIQLARQIADFGADIVLCHHHHNLRGVHFHQGVPIFQGIGAFAHHVAHLDTTSKQATASQSKYGAQSHGPREGFPLFPFHEDARMTGIVTIDCIPGDSKPGKRLETGLFPAMTLPDGSAEPLRCGDARVDKVYDYLRLQTERLHAKVRFEAGERSGYAHLRISAG